MHLERLMILPGGDALPWLIGGGICLVVLIVGKWLLGKKSDSDEGENSGD